MTHYSEEELILHYYGEHDGWSAAGRRREIARHVDECAGCAALYREVAGTLRLIEAPGIPERGDQYGLEVWQRIRSRLPEPEAPWWMRWDRLTAVSAISLLVVAAFFTGRMWPNTPDPAAPATAASRSADGGTSEARQRILLTSVADHLDRSERVLTEIMNAPEGGDISTEQHRAEDLVSTSRLYRQEAADAGEQSVAGVLEELERNLLEVVHSPSNISAADLDDARQRIDAAALLFKVRVLGGELRQRELAREPAAPSTAPHARVITSHIS